MLFPLACWHSWLSKYVWAECRRGVRANLWQGESELLKLVDGFSCCGETKWIGVPWCGAGARGRSGCCSGRTSASRIITGQLGEHGLRLDSASAPQTHGWTSHLLTPGVTRVAVVLCLSEDTVIRSEPVSLVLALSELHVWAATPLSYW